MKLSFIVPVYNVETYLSRCLDSLINQNIPHSEYEIIAINDGSTDNSLQILENYAKKFTNIKIYSKINGGLSSARNYGIERAIGDYIWMIDSDDSIKENCLKDLLEYAYKNDIDFLSLPIYDIFFNKIILSNYKNKPNDIIVSNKEYLDKYFVEHSACCFLIKSQILKKFRFIEGITQEDFEFVIRLLEKCNKITSFQKFEGVYNYYVGREGSITTTMNPEKYKKTLHSFFIFIKELQKKYSGKDISSYDFYASRYINNFKCFALSYLLYFPLSYKERTQWLNRYREIDIHQIGDTRFLSKKVTLMSYIYRYPSLYQLSLYIVSLFRK